MAGGDTLRSKFPKSLKLLHIPNWNIPTYLILKVGVKSLSRKVGFFAKKKGKSMWLNHPFKLRYNLDIQYGFGSGFYQIMAVKLKLPCLTKKWISQVFWRMKKLRYVWNICNFERADYLQIRRNRNSIGSGIKWAENHLHLTHLISILPCAGHPI